MKKVVFEKVRMFLKKNSQLQMMPLIKLNLACVAGVKGEGTGKKRAREPRDPFPPLLRPAMQAKPNGKVHAHACYGVDALDNYWARTLSYFKVAPNLVP